MTHIKISLHPPPNISVTEQLVSITSHVATVDNKGPKAVSNQNKTSLSSTLLQFLCLAKLTQKAFHPLLSHGSPTGYDPANLLLWSNHFVVKSFYVEEERSKVNTWTAVFTISKSSVYSWTL